MLVLAALIVGLSGSQQEAPPVRAGVMAAVGESFVVVLDGPHVAVGSAVTLVKIDRPQEVWRASVIKRLPPSDAAAQHALQGPVYELAAESPSPPLPRLAVAILGRAKVERVGDTVTLWVDAAPAAVQARSCASREGLHLTLWSGTPLESRRLWHGYYYLGYDVEPDCTPADTA